MGYFSVCLDYSQNALAFIDTEVDICDCFIKRCENFAPLSMVFYKIIH